MNKEYFEGLLNGYQNSKSIMLEALTSEIESLEDQEDEDDEIKIKANAAFKKILQLYSNKVTKLLDKEINAFTGCLK